MRQTVVFIATYHGPRNISIWEISILKWFMNTGLKFFRKHVPINVHRCSQVSQRYFWRFTQSFVEFQNAIAKADRIPTSVKKTEACEQLTTLKFWGALFNINLLFQSIGHIKNHNKMPRRRRIHLLQIGQHSFLSIDWSTKYHFVTALHFCLADQSNGCFTRVLHTIHRRFGNANVVLNIEELVKTQSQQSIFLFLY